MKPATEQPTDFKVFATVADLLLFFGFRPGILLRKHGIGDRVRKGPRTISRPDARIIHLENKDSEHSLLLHHAAPNAGHGCENGGAVIEKSGLRQSPVAAGRIVQLREDLRQDFSRLLLHHLLRLRHLRSILVRATAVAMPVEQLEERRRTWSAVISRIQIPHHDSGAAPCEVARQNGSGKYRLQVAIMVSVDILDRTMNGIRHEGQPPRDLLVS